jgi:hypothetical protein
LLERTRSFSKALHRKYLVQYLSFILFALFLSSNIAEACTPRYFNNHFDLRSGNEDKKLYAPKVHEINKFGSVNKKACSEIAFVKLKLTLPQRNNGYSISEVGFYIIPLNEETELSLFPKYPLKAQKNDNGEYFLSFSWFNDSVKGRNPKNLKFRIFTVNQTGWLSEQSEAYSIPEWW